MEAKISQFNNHPHVPRRPSTETLLREMKHVMLNIYEREYWRIWSQIAVFGIPGLAEFRSKELNQKFLIA